MKWMKFTITGVSLAITASFLGAAETVFHPQFEFRLTVPDGFVSTPEIHPEKYVFAFQRPPTADEKVGTFIAVSRLGGVLGREKLDPREIAAKLPQVTVSSESWKGFEIEVLRVPEVLGDVRMLTFNAQVPLKPVAIQVSVCGEASQEDHLREILHSLLVNLDGQTNWLNTEQRATKLTEGIARLAVTVAGLAIFAVVVWRIVRRRATDHGPRSGDEVVTKTGGSIGRRIAGLICLVVAAAAGLAAVRARLQPDSLAISDPSGLGISQAVGNFLPATLLLIVGLWLSKRPQS